MARKATLIRNPRTGALVNGAIIWEGPSRFDGSPIVVIATGIGTHASGNRKTGDAVQVWILRQDRAPMAAVRDGSDAAVCGSCPLRGDGTGKGRACYVNLGKAPRSVWMAYARGSYPRLTWSHAARLMRGRVVRLGAYGDPSMMPLPMARALVALASGRLGYTHGWRDIDPQWSRVVMASADSVADRRDARAIGYRSFYVMPKGSSVPRGTMECASTRTVNPLHCADCLACSGTRVAGRGVDVAIVAHGPGAGNVTA